MDMSMPGLNGIQACVEILKVLPKTAILMLSMYSEEAQVRNAIKAGAKGYVLKNAVDVDLASEIAALLELSPNTVAVHRANLMDALGIHRTAELVLYAVRKGLVHLP